MADEDRQTKRRLLALLACLPLFAATLLYGLLIADQQWAIKTSQTSFGESAARLIAQNVAPQVVDNDILSLNVIATRLVESEPILSVSVFNDEDQLLVQGGQSQTQTRSFTAEVTFQNSVVGFVRIAVEDVEQNVGIPLTIFVGLFAIYLVLIFKFSPTLLSWLRAEKKKPARMEETLVSDQPEYVETSMLVVRIKPARLLTRYFNRLFKAVKLYGGIIEQTTPEELVIHFEGPDAIFLSVCAGMLMQSIAAQTPGKMQFGGVLTNADDDTERSRKSASYLASISEGDLLFSKRDLSLDERVFTTPFQHGLVDSDELLRVTGLQSQQWLNAQADQLLSDQS